ncbi:MAG: phosphocholine cytidylyltransferase family protein [Patescibacteria group bacterium]
MKAIILAAGEARRLRPLTLEIPKCLLLVGEKTIIDYQIENLKLANIREVVVVTGFMADKLEQHLATNHPDIDWTFIRSTEYQKTYPAHGLWLAKAWLEETVLYLNADVICHPEIINGVVASEHDSITAIQRSAWDEEEVNVILKDDSSQIAEMGKYIAKTLNDGEFIGVTKIGKVFGPELIKVLDMYVEYEEFKKFAADAINLTIQRGHTMHALDVTNLPAIEIDTAEDLSEASKKLALILEPA